MSSVLAFPRMVNDKILSCIRGLETDQIPVWMMRQVGPYLPEFRDMCQHYNIVDIYTDPHLICQATLMPIRRFNFDAAIIFSDILVVPQALGMEVILTPKPKFPKPLTLEDIDTLQTEGAIDRLQYVGDALTVCRRELNGLATLIGFAGAPWTLMSYMIEGERSKTCSKAKKWLYIHETKARRLLDALADVVADYCVMQGRAGAQVIQIIDRNAEFLDKDSYTEFCIPGLRAIRDKVREEMQRCDLDVPMAIFAKGLHQSFEELVDAGYEVIGLDWRTEPIYVRSTILPRSVCLQGNFDPCALFAPEKDIRKMVFSMLKKFEGSKVIANLGYGIFPDTPLQSVYAFIEAVKDYSRTESDGSSSSSS